MLKRLFLEPQLPNEDATRVASVLHRALVLLILLESLAFLAITISDTPWLTTSILASLLFACVAGLYVLRQGQTRRAAALFCIIIWSITTLMSLVSGGMNSPMVFAYVGVITVAGLIFSRLVTIFVTAICVVSSCAIILISEQGWLPQELLTPDWLMVLLVQLLLFVWLACVLFLSKSSAEQALAQVRSKEKELERQTADLLRLNDELQQEISERQKALAAMHESENRFRTAVQYLPDMFVIYDADGKVRFANDNLLKALGVTWEEAQKCAGEEMVPNHVADAYRPLLTHALQTGEAAAAERTIELSDGSQHVYTFNYIPLRNEQDAIYEIIGVIKDITRQKQSEKAMEKQKDLLSLRVQERTSELSRANAQLVDAMRTKDEFLATINHELRTPLTSVILGTQMLQSEVYGTPSPEQKQFLDMIERNSHRLLTLINDILYFSKLEAGQFEPQITTIDVSQLCQDALDTAREFAVQKDIALQLKIDAPYGPLRADERSLKQILGNLLSNAIKFTPEEGEVGLHVSTNPTQQTISFCVWDTGIGIAEADMERVFQPFVQIDSGLARQYEGSGLGLALIRRLTDLHGGSVSLSSSVDSGSKFTISLPLSHPGESNESSLGIIRQDQTDPSTPPISKDSPASPEVCPSIRSELATHSDRLGSDILGLDTFEKKATGNGYKVLVAEDTELTLKTLTFFLRYLGCQVIMARNGLEAIERAFEEFPDVILMDIQMPVLGGLEAIERIRAHPEGKDIPIVALTALTMPGDREKCLQAGADLYVPKPVNMHELFDMIQQILKERS